MKKIFLISFVLIILISVSVVQANENITGMQTVNNDTTQKIEVISDTQDNEILTDNTPTQKEDLPSEIECTDYIVKPDPSDSIWKFDIKNIPDDYNECVSVHIDNDLIFNSKVHDEVTGLCQLYFDNIDLKALDIGKHTIFAQFPGNDKYNPLNLTHEFEIGDGYIDIPNEVKTTEHIHTYLKYGATGNLTIIVDGNEFIIVKIEANPVEGSHAFVWLNNLTKGTHFIEVIYSGDENTKKIYKNATVNIINGTIKTFEEIQTLINQSQENDIIELDGTYICSGKHITIDKSLTIQGNNNTILDAKRFSGIFDVISDNASLILKNLKIINAFAEYGENCVINFKSNLSLINCTFENNAATLINTLSYEKIITINDSRFENNAAKNLIRTDMAKISINNSHFLNNNATIIETLMGKINITNSNLENNIADYSLIYVRDSFGYAYLEMDNTNFTNNKLNKSDDNLIHIEYGNANIYNSNFLDNNACALYAYGGGLIINSTFENNYFAGDIGGNSKILYCQFINNTKGSLKLYKYINQIDDAPYQNPPSDNSIIINSTFKFNKGCAIYCSNNLNLINSIFENNTDNNAGSLKFDGEKAIIDNCTFKNNTIHSIITSARIYYDTKVTPILIINGKTYANNILDDNFTENSTENIVNVTIEYGMPIILNLNPENISEVEYDYSYYNFFGEKCYGKGNVINLCNSIELGVGEYTKKINIGTGLEKTITYKITITKAQTNITANVEDITYSEIATINITGTVNGEVIIKIDDNNTKTINITENTITPVTFENIPAGKHNVSVTLKPTYYTCYNESTYNTEFTVFKKQPSINIESEEKIEGNTLIVNVTVPKATGKIRINEKETDLVNGKARIELSDLILGDNTITVTYDGDDNNLNATSTTHVTVLAKDKPKNVTVIVDGKKHIAELVNDTIIINTEPKKASQLVDIVISDDQTISFVLKDEDDKSIANAPIKYTVNGKANTANTNKNGEFVIAGENGALITINYAGNENITGLNTNIKLNNPITPTVKVETHFNIANRAITIKGYAVDTKAGEEGIYYSTTLLDEKGNPIPGAYIEFALNNKIYNRTTYKNGSFEPYKFNMQKAGRYTMAFHFAGNETYTPSFACICVDLAKKPITIKANKKSYKASVKTKKYTVSLSTITGSSKDGKTHLKKGLEVTLTVNGKTYTGKTNNKGKATFKITNLNKKATYVAKINYKGDITYEEATTTTKLTIK